MKAVISPRTVASEWSEIIHVRVMTPKHRICDVYIAMITPPWSAQNPPRPPLVLVVDDDAALCWVVARYLRKEGYRAEMAGNARDALARIRLDHPGLLLLDMNLPDVHGSELAQLLEQGGMSVPIIVMTGAENARAWAERIGAALYVPKPLNLPLLVRRVAHVLARAA
jgi:two-component system OmpR family response regulator